MKNTEKFSKTEDKTTISKYEELSRYIINIKGNKVTKMMFIQLFLIFLIILTFTYRIILMENIILIENFMGSPSFIFWVGVALIVFLMILTTNYLSNLKELKYGVNYPKQDHIYFPFDRDFDSITRSSRYIKAKDNPRIAYTDPFYIHKAVPEWTTLEGYPEYVRWIPAYKKGENVSGLYFAILPVNISTTPGGVLMFRIFFKNTRPSTHFYSLKFTFEKLSSKPVPRSRIKELVDIRISGDQIKYKDVLLITPKKIEGVYELNLLDWWQVEKKSGDKKWKETYQNTLSVIRYQIRSADPKLKARFENKRWVPLLIAYSLHLNPFISPAGIKEMMIFSITGGDHVSKEYYEWKAKLSYRKFLILIISLFVLSLIIYFGINFISFWNVILAIFLLVELFLIESAFKVNTSHNKILYDMNLISREDYVSHFDINIAYETDEEILQIISMGERLQNQIIPIDFAISIPDIMNQRISFNHRMDLLKSENEKRFYYPQYQYRIKQINLPSLYHIPYFERDYSKRTINFNIDIPEQDVPIFAVDTDERINKTEKLESTKSIDCDNCGETQEIVFDYCYHCGSENNSSKIIM